MTEQEKAEAIERAAYAIMRNYNALNIGMAHARGMAEHALEAVGFFELVNSVKRSHEEAKSALQESDAECAKALCRIEDRLFNRMVDLRALTKAKGQTND